MFFSNVNKCCHMFLFKCFKGSVFADIFLQHGSMKVCRFALFDIFGSGLSMWWESNCQRQTRINVTPKQGTSFKTSLKNLGPCGTGAPKLALFDVDHGSWCAFLVWKSDIADHVINMITYWSSLLKFGSESPCEKPMFHGHQDVVFSLPGWSQLTCQVRCRLGLEGGRGTMKM